MPWKLHTEPRWLAGFLNILVGSRLEGPLVPLSIWGAGQPPKGEALISVLPKPSPVVQAGWFVSVPSPVANGEPLSRHGLVYLPVPQQIPKDDILHSDICVFEGFYMVCSFLGLTSVQSTFSKAGASTPTWQCTPSNLGKAWLLTLTLLPSKAYKPWAITSPGRQPSA